MEKYEPQVRRDLVEMVYDTIPFSAVVNILTGLVVLVVYWPKVGKNAVIWYALLVLATLYRLGVYFYYKAKEEDVSLLKAEMFEWSTVVVSAMVWLAGLWYFLGKQEIEYNFMIAFVMGGMASGAITTLSPLRITVVTYLVVILGGVAAWLLVSPNGIEVMMGVLVLIYLAFLVFSSGRIHHTIVDALVLRQENRQWIRALKAHRAEIELIFDNVPVGIFFYDKSFKVVNVNQRFLAIFETIREQVIGFDLEKVTDKRILPAIRRPIDYNGLEDGFYEGPYHTTLSGIDVEIRVKTTVLKDSKNRLVGAIGIVEDIGREVEQKRQVESFAQFYSQNPNPVMQIACADYSVTIENDAARTIHARLVSKDPSQWKRFIEEVCHDEQSIDLAFGGRVYQFESIKLDEERINVYGRDVTEERSAQELANRLAYYDELTSLPRRKLLSKHVNEAMVRAKEKGTFNALLFLDLDNFKQINDSMGHDVGDYLLQQLAKRLLDLMRTSDIVARLGGDEFVILLTDLEGNRDEAAIKTGQVAHEILQEISRPFPIQGRRLHFSASLGITLFAYGHNFFDLLKEADVAMYEAKSTGKNCIHFFDATLEKAISHKTELLQDLHSAIEKNQLMLLYQPQVEIATGRCVGAEALLRWEHPKRGVVSPAIFIPLAEESGLIHELGQWVLKRVCKETGSLPLDYIAVNISIREFVRSDFMETIRQMVASKKVIPNRIELEMTESVFVENFEESNKKLSELKEMGFRFSIDDFGTGYSSLAYLKNLSIKTLKIDQGFVQDIGINPNDEVLTRTIIDIAKHFGMKTVAEGVEDDVQLSFLKKFGCDIVQGYYFGKPMKIDAFSQWLVSSHSR